MFIDLRSTSLSYNIESFNQDRFKNFVFLLALHILTCHIFMRGYTLAKRKNKMSITKYKFDSEEEASYKLAQKWIELCQKYFPNYQHTHKKGFNLTANPKKSIIFKICYKLRRETKGLIDEADYLLYIRAQLEILKVQSQKNPLVSIEPACLIGDQAWKRWKLWKKKYDDKLKTKDFSKKTVSQSKVGTSKAIQGIVVSREFISNNIGKNPTIQDYIKNEKALYNWINFGKISPYYLAISPYIKTMFTEEDFRRLNFDLKVYQECITEEVLKVFDKLFSYENKK